MNQSFAACAAQGFHPVMVKEFAPIGSGASSARL